jgi:hypothetical protein
MGGAAAAAACVEISPPPHYAWSLAGWVGLAIGSEPCVVRAHAPRAGAVFVASQGSVVNC